MWEADCGSLPVIDAEGCPIAMITDRDICMAAHFQGAPLHVLRVRDAMSAAIYSCTPTDSVASAEDLMRTHQIRRLPVVNERSHVIGILSLNDIALEATAQATANRKDLTLKEVGHRLGITREWVRKIEMRAVRKLDDRDEADDSAARARPRGRLTAHAPSLARPHRVAQPA